MFAEDQVVRYADVAGRSLAWSSVGSGPPLLVGGWWSSHLQLDWENERFRRFLGRLAAHRAVVRYDRPGSGMSDRSGPVPADLEEELAVFEAVAELAGERRISILGASSGGPVVLVYAARHPERVDRLVLYGSYASGSQLATPAARQAALEVVERHWGLGSRMLADMFLPDSSARERDDFARFQRRSASREVALSSLRSVYAADVAGILDRVRAPTLVLHRRGDRAIPFALGRDLAARIPGARFVALEGIDHFPWRGDRDAVVDEALRFLGVAVESRPAPATPDRALSERELDVLRLVARGLTDEQIGGALSISPHTVHRHVANALRKLGAASRAAATATALQRGLL